MIKANRKYGQITKIGEYIGEYEIGLRSSFCFIMRFSRFIGSLKDLRVCESGSAELDTW